MLKGINHVAVAVPSLDDALPIYRDLLGFDLCSIEEVADQKVRVAILAKGTHRIELVEPILDDSPIARFLARHGPGLHHICLEVEGLESMLTNLAHHGLRLIDAEPRPGAAGRRVAFVHPESTAGVLIELSEAPGKDPE